MAEGLTKKKRIRAGHRASATRTLTKVTEALAEMTAETVDRDTAKLSQLKLEQSSREARDAEIVGQRNSGADRRGRLSR